MEKRATAGIKTCKKGKGKVPVDQLPCYTGYPKESIQS